VFGGEKLMTHRALVTLPLLMDDHVLVEVSLLSEALTTAWQRADKRSLPCVDPQMIEEIMPFPKVHLAAIVVAFQDLNQALSPWVLVFVDPELSG